jgi:lactoylglutathione lyase
MIKKLTLFIYVKDQEKALDFYNRVLGLEKRADLSPPGNPRWVTVTPGGRDMEMSLYPPQPPERAFTWTLETDDCYKDFEELNSRGVKFEEKEPVKSPWGISAVFSDPDGNRFSLYQPNPEYHDRLEKRS